MTFLKVEDDLVRLCNTWDAEAEPSGYIYIKETEHPTAPLLEDAQGCCEGCQGCQWPSGDSPLDPSYTASLCLCSSCGSMAENSKELPLRECGPACACTSSLCRNRVSQRGLPHQIKLHKTEKGWSAFAGEDIAPGCFVCQYAGELVSNAEAAKRLAGYDTEQAPHGHALLIIREVLPSRNSSIRINVDATRRGNVARFINHDCDGGNLQPRVVRVAGKLVPHVGMYSKKKIQEGEELTFQYGLPNAGPIVEHRNQSVGHSSGSSEDARCQPKNHLRTPRRCFCNSPGCLGYLPNDPV